MADARWRARRARTPRQKAPLEAPLPQFTRTTITDLAELPRELRKSYERG